MFLLIENEIVSLVSQNVILSKKYFGGSKPMAFTEQGIAMLSTVLSSERAIGILLNHLTQELKRRYFLRDSLCLLSVSQCYLLVFITQSATEKSQSYTEIKLLRKVLINSKKILHT